MDTLDPLFDISDISFSPEYAITKANLAYFQPSLLSHSKELYLSLKKQQNEFKNQFQFQSLYLAYQKKGNEAFLELLKTGPVIFVSYHMGPVGPLLTYISNHEINFTLLFDQFYYEKWADRYLSLYHEYIEKNGLNHLFEILNTEEKQSGVKIMKALRDKSSLLLFIDGNTGVGGANRQDSKLCIIDFFGKKILARKGIAYFSQLFNAPIIPVVSYYEKSRGAVNYFLEFSDPLFPDKSIPKEQFEKKITQLLYNILEKYILRYPDQWEGWLYVHNFIDKNEIPEVEIQVEPNDESLPLRFNDTLFSFTFHDGKYFLFNMANYRKHPISKDIYNLLSSLQTPKVIAKNIGPDSITQLLKKGILTKA